MSSATRKFSTFQAHADKCPRCALVDPERPATLASACLYGAQVFKDGAELASQELRRASRRGHREAHR